VRGYLLLRVSCWSAEWVAFKLFLGTKIHLFFFLPEIRKKQKCPKTRVWVALNFSGGKNTPLTEQMSKITTFFTAFDIFFLLFLVHQKFQTIKIWFLTKSILRKGSFEYKFSFSILGRDFQVYYLRIAVVVHRVRPVFFLSSCICGKMPVNYKKMPLPIFDNHSRDNWDTFVPVIIQNRVNFWPKNARHILIVPVTFFVGKR